MLIAPDSTIRFYSGIPLDNTYNHTLWFDSIDWQNSYFHYGNNKLKRTVTGSTYQRVNNNRIRVPFSADELYDCNYLAFQNTGFGNKWFYAFVNKVEYVNNRTCEVEFEIDVMQTYLFDIDLGQCYVEREHSSVDTIGSNIVDENIAIGDIVCSSIQGTSKFDDYVCVIATAYDPDNPDSVAGGYQAGLFSGVKYVAGAINSETGVNKLLQFLRDTVNANLTDSVVSLFVMPQKFYTSGDMPVVETERVKKVTDIDGYVPRNNKLLTYPYNYLCVDCGNNSAIYRYEWFEGAYCDFSEVGTVCCNPQIGLIPMYYDGSNGLNYTEKLVMSDFPQVAFTIDTYRAWVAQDATSSAIPALAGLTSLITGMASSTGDAPQAGSLTGTATLATGLATGNAPLILAGGLATANSLVTMNKARNKAPHAVGVNSGSLDVATRSKNFYFKAMHITKEYARMIDGYFDMFGYATKEVKIPNRAVRPHWNYVKTSGCVIYQAKAPVDDVKKVCAIYDKGITFWKNPNEVGNYSFDNTISG